MDKQALNIRMAKVIDNSYKVSIYDETEKEIALYEVRGHAEMVIPAAVAHWNGMDATGMVEYIERLEIIGRDC